MKKTLTVAAAFMLLAGSAFAQATPNGQSSGGPARPGYPGQVQQGGTSGMEMNNSDDSMMEKKMMHKKHRKHSKKMHKSDSMMNKSMDGQGSAMDSKGSM